MLKAFLQHLRKEQLLNEKGKTLLAVSGGVDSVVMAELFNLSKIPFAIAHCNFQLRGKESNEDESFVETLAERYGVPFHSIRFETKKYIQQHKLSVQEAARKLRYDWFGQLVRQFNYSSIATAHHADDSVETFLINLIRGSGISGMHGILPKQGNLIRPLLFADKKAIEAFAKSNKLQFRPDSSNTSEKYLRNKIRLKIIPMLKSLNPEISATLFANIQHLREAEIIVKKETEKKRKRIFKITDDQIFLSIKELKKLDPLPLYLFEFLRPFGYNSSMVKQIMKTMENNSGRRFLSVSHILLVDRNNIIIKTKEDQAEKKEIRITRKTKKIPLDHSTLSFNIFSHSRNMIIKKDPATASLDLGKLEFPLRIRKWQKGDIFRPIGMKGKKKLSDFFVDKKLSVFEKENVYVLLSANKIAWVIGHRISEDFKISNHTEKIFFAELHL